MAVLQTVFLSSAVLLSSVASAAGSTGTLNVRVNGTSQLSSVPQGAQRLPMLTVQLSASCDAPVTVSALTVHHSGLGAASDFLRIYALEGTKRLTRSAVLHATPPIATVRFVPALVIARCNTRTITIAADISSDAASGAEHRLTINDQSDISASANTVTITASVARTIHTTPSVPASLSISFLPITSNAVLFGGNRTIARFQLTSTSNHDQLVRSITLTNDGSARDTDLQQLFLTTSGNRPLTNTLPSLNGATATCVFDPPLRLPAHGTMLLQLHADVRASKRRTIKIILEEPSDIDAVDATRSTPST